MQLTNMPAVHLPAIELNRGPWAHFISRHEALHGMAENQAPDNAVEPPEHGDDILEAEHAPEVVSDEEAEAVRQYAANCPTSDEEPPIASPSKPDTTQYICQGPWSALHSPAQPRQAKQSMQHATMLKFCSPDVAASYAFLCPYGRATQPTHALARGALEPFQVISVLRFCCALRWLQHLRPCPSVTLHRMSSNQILCSVLGSNPF